MRIELAYISPRRQRLKSSAAQSLVDEYVKRGSHYCPLQTTAYDSESGLLQAIDKAALRSPVTLVLLDSRGEALASEAIAERLRRMRDAGAQQLVFAIGPADGWSSQALGRAQHRLSFGAITLPHELALAVLAEQVYRCLTILAGHPYHGGHA